MRVAGQLIVNDIALALHAACDGLGIVFLPEDYALPDIAAGHLGRVLQEWCAAFPDYHLYYPSRRQHALTFQLLVDLLRSGRETGFSRMIVRGWPGPPGRALDSSGLHQCGASMPGPHAKRHGAGSPLPDAC